MHRKQGFRSRKEEVEDRVGALRLSRDDNERLWDAAGKCSCSRLTVRF